MRRPVDGQHTLLEMYFVLLLGVSGCWELLMLAMRSKCESMMTAHCFQTQRLAMPDLEPPKGAVTRLSTRSA